MSLTGTPGKTVTEQVVSAVAEREGVDERDLRRPLFDVIDPDALEHVFRSGQGQVSFQYLGYHVTVSYETTPVVDVSSSAATD